MTKKFWMSRTLWVNIIAAVAMFVQNQYGYAIAPEMQGYLLIALNLFLRTITKSELSA